MRVGQQEEVCDFVLDTEIFDRRDGATAVSIAYVTWQYPKVVEKVGTSFDDSEESDGLPAESDAADEVFLDVGRLDAQSVSPGLELFGGVAPVSLGSDRNFAEDGSFDGKGRCEGEGHDWRG